MRGRCLPFGAGPRVCIGQHFAMLEMTLVAAMRLQRHPLLPLDGEPVPRPVMHVTLRPTVPLWLRLRARPVGLGPMRFTSPRCPPRP